MPLMTPAVGARDLAGIGRVGLRMGALDDAQRVVAHVDFARLAVQFKEERARAVGMRVAGGQKFDDERFSRIRFRW